MENEFYTDDFEQMLKERADQFRMYPSKRVWHSIYNNLHPSRRWPSLVMSLLLVTSLMVVGYLNSGESHIASQGDNKSITLIENKTDDTQKTNSKRLNLIFSKTQQQWAIGHDNTFDDVITKEPDFNIYTIVKSNRPKNFFMSNNLADAGITSVTNSETDNSKGFIQSVDIYIKSNRIYADIANVNKKITDRIVTASEKINNIQFTESGKNKATENINASLISGENAGEKTDLVKSAEELKNTITDINAIEDKAKVINQEKAWIENYALLNKPASKKWKGRIAYQIYITPAVNYRKLSTNSKGSNTAFANSDINNSISQKPGFGIEGGAGLSYAAAKNIQVKIGFQFNYTNYNIAADQTNHPILTTLLLNDPTTGYSYSSLRTSTTSNSFNTTALQPVTLHNRTYQISMPVGLAYKLSSQKNVDWFAGASVQPTYVFGGNAHLLSTDLKSYISDPSTIRSWNLNLGFETFMNFKIGSYNLQAGPQVRYQVYSTYQKNVALIEKPYAVGFKLGLSKGF